MAVAPGRIRARALASTCATRIAQPRRYGRYLSRSRNGLRPAQARHQVACRQLRAARPLRPKQSECRLCPGLPLRPKRTASGRVDWVELPTRLDNYYDTRVCAVDSDGNEV